MRFPDRRMPEHRSGFCRGPSAGHEAQHVVHMGKAGWKDWNVAPLCRDGDFVLVTNNASDFRKLYARTLLHTGQSSSCQMSLALCSGPYSGTAIDAAASAGELVNRVIQVNIEGEDVTLDLTFSPAAPTA